MDLSDLGDRICVIGRSGSGKSTVADAIGRRTGLPPVHLDQFRHIYGTQWQLRSDDEFRDLHDSALATDRWVIEGNYSPFIPERLNRASGLILLEISTLRSLGRYIRRTMWSRRRIGGLGHREKLSWKMIGFITLRTRATRKRRRDIFDQATLPKIMLVGNRSIRRFYKREHLDRL